MNASFKLFQRKQPRSPAQGYEAAIYTHRSDVKNDPKLTTGEKGGPGVVDFGCPGGRERSLVAPAR
jgi:hypothetical protein